MFRLLGRIYHRENDTIRPYLQHRLDIGNVVVLYPDKSGAAAGVGSHDSVLHHWHGHARMLVVNPYIIIT